MPDEVILGILSFEAAALARCRFLLASDEIKVNCNGNGAELPLPQGER
jgi:hypothetical protein